jgi:hypothetical protein
MMGEKKTWKPRVDIPPPSFIIISGEDHARRAKFFPARKDG